MATKTEVKAISIKAPKFEMVDMVLEGTAPLVIARFSKKGELMDKMAQGSTAKSKKDRQARDYDAEADAARHYNSTKEWEGIHAGAFRAAAIRACSLVNFKMTLAKLSIFIVQDDFDLEYKTPLVRIYGDSETDTSYTRNATGVVDVRARPMYKRWASKLRVRYDADQFTSEDVFNLIARVGVQIGVGEGRPGSKDSAGCGWGTFRIVPDEELDSVVKAYGIK